jgi:hypothetical protein
MTPDPYATSQAPASGGLPQVPLAVTAVSAGVLWYRYGFFRSLVAFIVGMAGIPLGLWLLNISITEWGFGAWGLLFFPASTGLSFWAAARWLDLTEPRA